MKCSCVRSFQVCLLLSTFCMYLICIFEYICKLVYICICRCLCKSLCRWMYAFHTLLFTLSYLCTVMCCFMHPGKFMYLCLYVSSSVSRLSSLHANASEVLPVYVSVPYVFIYFFVLTTCFFFKLAAISTVEKSNKKKTGFCSESKF